jgi:tetratricopeptide (TPR) repeat protein
MAAGEIVMIRLFLLLILLLVGPASVRAAAPEYVATEFERANKLYEQGHFSEAAAAYGNLTKAGAPSSAVWFNLGNAAYKSGQIGSSIFAYRMAERQSPRDTALRANLQFVRAKAYSGEGARVPFWTIAVRLATLDEWALLGAGFLWAFFGVLIFGQVKGQRFPKTSAAMFCLFALGAGAMGLAWMFLTSPLAIVFAWYTTVRRGPYE